MKLAIIQETLITGTEIPLNVSGLYVYDGTTVADLVFTETETPVNGVRIRIIVPAGKATDSVQVPATWGVRVPDGFDPVADFNDTAVTVIDVEVKAFSGGTLLDGQFAQIGGDVPDAVMPQPTFLSQFFVAVLQTSDLAADPWTVDDQSGNGNDGTSTESIVGPGASLKITGTSYDLSEAINIAIMSNISIPLSVSFTISVRVRRLYLADWLADDARIFGSQNSNDIFRLYYSSGVFRAEHESTDVASSVALPTTIVGEYVDLHYAFDAGTGEAAFYVNDPTAPAFTFTGLPVLTTGNSLGYGHNNFNNGLRQGFDFITFHEGVVLNAAEIEQLQNYWDSLYP